MFLCNYVDYGRRASSGCVVRAFQFRRFLRAPQNEIFNRAACYLARVTQRFLFVRVYFFLALQACCKRRTVTRVFFFFFIFPQYFLSFVACAPLAFDAGAQRLSVLFIYFLMRSWIEQKLVARSSRAKRRGVNGASFNERLIGCKRRLKPYYLVGHQDIAFNNSNASLSIFNSVFLSLFIVYCHRSPALHYYFLLNFVRAVN